MICRHRRDRSRCDGAAAEIGARAGEGSVGDVDRAEAARELGVASQATPIDVERAFRRAARSHHPDLGGDPRRFHRVIEARAVLLEPARDDPFVRAAQLVVRYHPVVRLVDVLVRVADRRPVR